MAEYKLSYTASEIDERLERVDAISGHEDRILALEQNGGVYVGSGEMPDNCNVQIDPNGTVMSIPTKTSELENDSGFITADDIPVGSGGASVDLKTINEQSLLGSGNINTAQMVNLLPSPTEATKNTIYVVNNDDNDSKLPNDYVKLICISSKLVENEGAYIELPFGYDANTKYEIDTKLNVNQTHGTNPNGIGWDYGGMIGCKGGSTFYGDGTNTSTISCGNIVAYNQVINGNSTVTSITDEHGETVNLSRTNSLATYAIQNYTIGKITRRSESYYPKELIIYYAKIKIDDVLTYDLVPAKRVTDDVIGLYDMINNVFYASLNTSVNFSGVTPTLTCEPYIFNGADFVYMGLGGSNNSDNSNSICSWINPEIKKFNIIAHRGLHSTEVSHENTIEAFEAAYKVGYRYIECDVIPTTDGFVIHHDKTVSGNTLTSMTMTEVTTAIPYIPTVESVIKWAKKRNVCVDLDTAGRVSGAQLSALYDLVKKYNMLGNVVFTSYQDNLEFLIAENKTNCNACLTYMNTTPTVNLINAIPKAIISAFNHFEVSINNSYLSDATMIEACHNRDLWCRTWTLTSEASCLNFINMGIDKIFVDADALWDLDE
jgi:glycerophosphoryl diester phosphodiesterase